MSIQKQEDMKLPREQWRVGTLRTSKSPWMIYGAFFIFFVSSWFWSSRLTIIDNKLTLKQYQDYSGGYQLSPQQVVKILPSRNMYLGMLILPILLLVILIVSFIQSNTLPTAALVLLALIILIHVIPVILFKCYRIHHQVKDYPKYIYFCCLRHQSSSIVDALTRCGFGDKLEQPHVSSKPDHTS